MGENVEAIAILLQVIVVVEPRQLKWTTTNLDNSNIVLRGIQMAEESNNNSLNSLNSLKHFPSESNGVSAKGKRRRNSLMTLAEDGYRLFIDRLHNTFYVIKSWHFALSVHIDPKVAKLHPKCHATAKAYKQQGIQLKDPKNCNLPV